MIVKHSKRTLRSGCPDCGSKHVYIGHDTSVRDNYCEQCDEYGYDLLIDADTLEPHALTCPGTKPAPTPAAMWDPAVITPKPVEEPPAVPTTTKTAPDAASAAMAALMAALTPTVSRDEIVEIVKAEFQATVFPTRTVVERLDGTVKPVEGKTHHKTADVITDLMAGEHVMMVGPAGTGKSTIAEQAAEALGFEYGSISLSPMTPASAILGYMQATGEYVSTIFRERYENGGVFHFDEIDNSHPSTLAVVNAALANGQMAFPDGMVKRHANFRCVASANTYGKGADRQYVGRQAIDAATLDRFSVETIEIDEALETDLCMSTGLDAIQVGMVLEYVRKYRATAVAKKMSVVISPRASVGMCRLLNAGRSWDDAVEARIRRGMSDADWAKLTKV